MNEYPSQDPDNLSFPDLTEAQKKLLEAATKRKSRAETEQLEKAMVGAGVLDHHDGLIRVKSQYKSRKIVAISELPTPLHHFSYPLSKQQVTEIVAGDRINRFPLIKVIKNLERINPAWIDPIGKLGAHDMAEIFNVELVVQEVHQEAITIQVLLPDTPQLSAKAFWKQEQLALDLPISALSHFNNLRELFR